MIDKQKYLESLNEKILSEKYEQKYADTCVQYADRLLSNNLPVIFNLDHLSKLIGIESFDLSVLIYGHKNRIYKKVFIPKKNGKKRELNIPTINLKYIQRWILDNILVNMHTSAHSTGFIRDSSIFKNAKVHIGSDCIINMDIKNFFPSIDSDRVFRIFKYYGYTKQVSFILSKLCTYDFHLPQGSPASPCLSNIACLKLDKRLSLLCETFKGKYTRYADDITISGSKGIEKFLKVITEIIEGEGFKVNNKKTRIAYKYQRQEITGLNINSGQVTVPQKYKRELSSEIYYCKKYGVDSHMKYKGIDKAFYKEHLYGKAYFIYMIEKSVGVKFLKSLDEIVWDY